MIAIAETKKEFGSPVEFKVFSIGVAELFSRFVLFYYVKLDRFLSY
jgi:hypothetical protein